MWACGPRPRGPQAQKEVANHGVWTACTIKWDSNGTVPIFFFLPYRPAWRNVPAKMTGHRVEIGY
jgi:hypothetical protein